MTDLPMKTSGCHGKGNVGVRPSLGKKKKRAGKEENNTKNAIASIEEDSFHSDERSAALPRGYGGHSG